MGDVDLLQDKYIFYYILTLQSIIYTSYIIGYLGGDWYMTVTLLAPIMIFEVLDRLFLYRGDWARYSLFLNIGVANILYQLMNYTSITKLIVTTVVIFLVHNVVMLTCVYKGMELLEKLELKLDIKILYRVIRWFIEPIIINYAGIAITIALIIYNYDGSMKGNLKDTFIYIINTYKEDRGIGNYDISGFAYLSQKDRYRLNTIAKLLSNSGYIIGLITSYMLGYNVGGYVIQELPQITTLWNGVFIYPVYTLLIALFNLVIQALITLVVLLIIQHYKRVEVRNIKGLEGISKQGVIVQYLRWNNIKLGDIDINFGNTNYNSNETNYLALKYLTYLFDWDELRQLINMDSLILKDEEYKQNKLEMALNFSYGLKQVELDVLNYIYVNSKDTLNKH